MKNAIGIETHLADELVGRLNDLLANYMLFYQNSRGFHWNIRGEKFFELHLKFEELYTNLLVKVDEIAERVLTLGGTPLHTFTGYTAASDIKAAQNVSDANECIRLILDAFQIVILKQRELLELSAKAGDEGTNSLMSDYIREQEKLVWMYHAYLSKPS